ncbi:MAG: hypothetical protein LRS41_04600 [Caldisphaeraceae archaeon]|nr:hypothetical protein [Caldisphaeraceae archaeon]
MVHGMRSQRRRPMPFAKKLLISILPIIAMLMIFATPVIHAQSVKVWILSQDQESNGYVGSAVTITIPITYDGVVIPVKVSLSKGSAYDAAVVTLDTLYDSALNLFLSFGAEPGTAMKSWTNYFSSYQISLAYSKGPGKVNISRRLCHITDYATVYITKPYEVKFKVVHTSWFGLAHKSWYDNYTLTASAAVACESLAPVSG